MSGLWSPVDEPDPVKIGVLGWILVLLRIPVLIAVISGGLVVLLILRLIEYPVFGQHRPVTPSITQGVCKLALLIMGLRHSINGSVMSQKGAIVCNHASWVDIFTLNASKRIYFVAKSEVEGWLGIGWLARATGTVFITRRTQEAKTHQDIFADRLNAGHKLLFFPEGTSTDGLRVLTFKSTLFQPFFADNLRQQMYIQPVTVRYTAPKNHGARFYGWWGDMELAPHLIKTLSSWRRGAVEVVYHAPVAVADFADRKALAKTCEQIVRAGL